LPPNTYNEEDFAFLVPRVVELMYTAHDMVGFARDLGVEREPYIWDGRRRSLLRAEIDAFFAHMYELTREELEYILDPKSIYGPEFPGLTFRVLKMKEEKEYGEYVTQRLVLAAFDKLATSKRFVGARRESAIEIPRATTTA
jgi:hypothetical protein